MKLLAHDLRWQLVAELACSDHRVHELGERTHQAQNLVSYHLAQLRRAGVVRERRSSADARDVYYSLDMDGLRFALSGSVGAVHPALQVIEQPPSRVVPDRVSRVLFICTHNSARSQMAEAILRHHGRGWVEVASAGSDPRQVHPEAIKVLEELGFNGKGLYSKHLDELADQRFDYVITLCDIVREICPRFPGDPEHLHWSLADPAATAGPPSALEMAFRRVAEEVATRVRYLIPVLRHRSRAGRSDA